MNVLRLRSVLHITAQPGVYGVRVCVAIIFVRIEIQTDMMVSRA